ARDAARIRGGFSYKVTTPGGRAYRALWRTVGSTFPNTVPTGRSRARATPALSARLRRRAGVPPGGTSTSSSAGQQEGPHIEPTGALRGSHPGRVLLQGYDAREASLSRPVAACGLDVPGKRAPRGVAHLRYTCVVCPLAPASRCPPGRDEHQLVRGAAEGRTHRANRRSTLFAPGAGAPAGLRHPG